ncbi:hypothetical protein BGW38_010823, partial [Lunasporangiospora selenospora]
MDSSTGNDSKTSLASIQSGTSPAILDGKFTGDSAHTLETAIATGIHRFYLKEQPDQALLHGSRIPSPPTIIKSGTTWKCIIPFENIPDSAYWITFGVSYKGEKQNALTSFMFSEDALMKDFSKFLNYKGDIIFLEEDELDVIVLQSEWDLGVFSIDFTDANLGDLELQYIELNDNSITTLENNELEQIHISKLADFRGSCQIFNRDSNDPQEEDDRLITCDGKTVSVYKTNDSWDCLYSIKIGVNFDQDLASELVGGVRGGYFVWMGEVNVASIWNAETGKNISHVPIIRENLLMDYAAKLSYHGTRLVICSIASIDVYDTVSGTKIKSSLPTIENNKSHYSMNVLKEHIVLSVSGHTPEENSRLRVHRLVNQRTLTDEQQYICRDGYIFYSLPLIQDRWAVRLTGSSLDFLKVHDGALAIESGPSDNQCDFQEIKFDELGNNFMRDYEMESGAILSAKVELQEGYFEYMVRFELFIKFDGQDEPHRLFQFSEVTGKHKIFVMRDSSQLIHFTSSEVYIWNIPTAVGEGIAFAGAWRNGLDNMMGGSDIENWDIQHTQYCKHCRRLEFEYTGTSFEPDEEEAGQTEGEENPIPEAEPLLQVEIDGLVKIGESNDNEKTEPTGDEEGENTEAQADDEANSRKKTGLTIPRTARETYHYLVANPDYIPSAVFGAVFPYLISTGNIHDATSVFLKELIFPGSPISNQSLLAITYRWISAFDGIYEKLLRTLLSPDTVTWIPEGYSEEGSNLIDPLITDCKEYPTAFRCIKIIVEYCVAHAHGQRNLVFAAPILGRLKYFLEVHPDFALRTLEQLAFIPIKSRKFIVDNHQVAHPPRFRLRFWRPSRRPLHRTKDPILQVHPGLGLLDPQNKYYKGEVFQASFDALWHYLDEPRRVQADEEVSSMSFPRMLFEMFKLRAQFDSKLTVEYHEFNIDHFDNPAITALVSYKWNTIGFMYWLVRFMLECIFYALVVIAAILQIYNNHQQALEGIFITIVIFVAFFFFLEIGQARNNWHRYRSSGYNILDALGFGLPLAASIQQLVLIQENKLNPFVAPDTANCNNSTCGADGSTSSEIQENTGGAGSTTHSWLLSYSVLVVFLHLQAIFQIRVFFFIFAAGVIVFTLAILHLLRACPVGTCNIDTQFPKNFVFATSATFYFM